MPGLFKKRLWPSLISRPHNVTASKSLGESKAVAHRKKKCRRSLGKQERYATVKIKYANIQGFTGKKTSLQYTMDALNVDLALIAETMARKVTLQGCQCVCPKESVGQNVAVIMAGKTCSYKKMRLYEPNDVVNMMGVRLEIKGTGVRLYTAHLKQQSTHTKEEISRQFDELKNQFRSANAGREGMIIIFDANVHVGSQGVSKCNDVQDVGGRMLLSLVKDEGLTIINDLNICKGCVTRVDPRNGTKTTIDLAICNTFMTEKLNRMIIEGEQWRLKKYGKKVTKTDHNTILVEMKVERNLYKNENHEIRYNIRNEQSRRRLCNNLEDDSSFDNLFTDINANIDSELNLFMSKWDGVIRKSFEEVKPSKSRIPGVNPEVKELLKRETWIRKNVTDNVERGRAISEIQKIISLKIAENLAEKVEAQVQEIIKSDNPHSKVFQVRRKTKKNLNLDFPLKDRNGVLQVSKSGIEKVITDHFQKVFAQNDVPKEQVWQDYWKVVDQTFDNIDSITAEKYCAMDEPTESEIDAIIRGMSSNKACYGSLTIDLAKLGGKRISSLIHRCILMCFRQNVIPSLLREEKMTLLLKNHGLIDEINDYRGIFLRHLIICVYQKWLYQKNSGVVDEAGSEFAFGGRKERSGMDALLVLKLVQDYVKWTKKELVIEFLDVEKFFDSMNYKLALIEAYRNGVDRRYWQSYKTINSKKKRYVSLTSHLESVSQLTSVMCLFKAAAMLHS